MLRSRDDARDVTQEVLIRFWRRLDEIEEATALAWLMRVTRNACIDVLRQRKRMRDLVSTDAEVDGLPHDDLPSDHLQQLEDREAIEAAIAALGEPYRSIIILRELQHLKYEEICGALDLPLNTVKVYLHRARKMLRRQLTEVLDRERV